MADRVDTSGFQRAQQMIGRVLGRYRIEARLGEGGTSVVYRAYDTELRRDVAIKVLSDTVAEDAARERLLREARSASALNHPNICTVHEVGRAQGQTFIVMEYVEGEQLSELISRGDLPVETVIAYGIQIAEALADAHERGVVHRDLKCANVVITPEARLKVLDFGLAKRLSGEAVAEAMTRSEASQTVPGTLVGTLAYMAPEQLRGRPADARSDIWALGVMLYEMAAGARPFQGQTGFELSSDILNNPPPQLPAKVPVELRAVIDQCLAKEPARRYQHAGEVRAALKAIQSGVVPWAAWHYRLARRRWLALVVTLAAVVAVVAALDVGGLRERLWGGASAPRISSLAVLPLANLSGDPEQDYFAAGIHEALIIDLARLGSFKRVIARSSVMSYQNTHKPLPQVGRELGVDAIITGSVLREGNRVRVTAQLIDATTQDNLWADRYERELRDVLSLQNEIVAAIARGIKLQLAPLEQARLASARVVNPEAYDAYLKGRFYLNKFTPDGFQKGLAYLQQAIEKDPANPLPYAGLALGYSLIGHEAVPDAFTRAKAAAARALELGETLAETHEALAEIKLYSDWDFAGAEQDFRRALELNPSLPDAHAHYAWYLWLMGHIDDALAEMRRAQEVDPLAPLWPAWQGWIYWWAGRYEEAIAEARKSLELNPDFPWGLYVLGGVYAQKGMYEEAIAAHQKASEASRAVRWGLGHTYALTGRIDEALKVAAELKKDPTPMNAWGLSEIYAALGQTDEAFRWLEAAYKSRFSWMPWVRQDPSFAPLRDDPRFQDLLHRMNLPP